MFIYWDYDPLSQEDDFRPASRMPPQGGGGGGVVGGGGGGGGGYGAYNAYISAATRYAALGAPTLYDPPASASMYGSKLQ